MAADDKVDASADKAPEPAAKHDARAEYIAQLQKEAAREWLGGGRVGLSRETAPKPPRERGAPGFLRRASLVTPVGAGACAAPV